MVPRAAALFSLLLALPILAGSAGRAAEPPRLLLIGDSTVASYDKPLADRPDLNGWGQVFHERFLPGTRVVNRARSGASSKSFLRTGLWKAALAEEADYVFIQFGHNDQPGKGDRTTDPAGDYRELLRQYLREARERKMRPILVTPVARRTFAGGHAVSTLGPYADAMKAVGKEQGVPVVDLHAAGLALFDRMGDRFSADFSPSAGDRTHFSRRGARAMARLVADALPDAVPELRPFLNRYPQLTLPPVTFAVPGVEAAVYYANAALVPPDGAYRYTAECAVGSAGPERWTLTATAKDLGDHRLRLEAQDEAGAFVDEAFTTVRVVPADAEREKPLTLLMIGDSLTHASLYPNEVARLLSTPGNPKWTMLGMHRPASAAPGVQHEGYGGWTWERFVRRYDPQAPAAGAGRSSPFVFAGKEGEPPVLDAARYLEEQCEGRRPDFITIMLGINDCFGLSPEDGAALDRGIDGTFQHAEALIAAFRRAAPQAEIGVCLTPPPNTRDAAFQANYKDRYPRWGWRRIQHRLVQRQIARFGGREAERIFLTPTGWGLDATGGYPENNAVHPNEAGYRQLGAEVYAWLKARLHARGRG